MSESEPDLSSEVSEKKLPRSPEEIIAFGEQVLRGEYSGHLDDYEQASDDMVPVQDTAGDFDPEDAVILDLNDDRVPQADRDTLINWMQGHLDAPLDASPVSTVLIHPDGTTSVNVYAKAFGKPDDLCWHFSRWESEGDQPFYIIWSKEMYDEQEEFGFDRVDYP